MLGVANLPGPWATFAGLSFGGHAVRWFGDRLLREGGTGLREGLKTILRGAKLPAAARRLAESALKAAEAGSSARARAIIYLLLRDQGFRVWAETEVQALQQPVGQ